MDSALIVAVALQIVVGIVWLVRLEGRIKVQAAIQDTLEDRLSRIEIKLDRLIERFGPMRPAR